MSAYPLMPDGFVHPELQAGEVFVTNAQQPCNPEIGELPIEETFPFPARKGLVAYRPDGTRIATSAYYPIFVKRADLVVAGFDPDNLFQGLDAILEGFLSDSRSL